MRATNLEIEIAKAINGPWDFNDHLKDKSSKYKLNEVRSVKWLIVGSAGQSELIYGVRSIIKMLHEKPELMQQFTEAVRDYK